MVRRKPLTFEEKESIYFGKLAGKPLKMLAKEVGCSFECARKWWRIGRDGGIDTLRQERPIMSPKGALSHFSPLVAERALYWKRRYPRRGPDRILVEMSNDKMLHGLKLPKPSTLAFFFKEACPELLRKEQAVPEKPPQPSGVHHLWQMDAKEKIVLGDGTIVTVLQMREPVACVFLGCFAHAVQTKTHYRKLSLAEIQADLRFVFTEFGLPLGLQTDRERVYGRPATEAFPTLFTLWLVGLGITHHFTRPAQPTDQAQVERGHQTWNDWLFQPIPTADLVTYQAELAKARYMHNQVLSSRAGDCQGRIPYQAHPEVCVPLQPFVPEAELLLFKLARVDSFLAQFSWQHKVTKSGQVWVGETSYYVGQAHAGLNTIVSFDPDDRHFVFKHAQTPKIFKRCPAKKLDVPTITGLKSEIISNLSKPFQLPLPSVGGTPILDN
jgi:transposase InsO family protein